MRSYTLVGLLALVVGCSGGQAGSGAFGDPDSEEGAIDQASADEDIGQTQQKSQFADGTVVNLVDPVPFGLNVPAPILTVTADFNPVTVNVYYVSDKTTNSGHQVGTVELVQTLSLAADQTKVHTVNMGHAAFNGAYGTVLLDANGFGPFDVFQTYAKYGGSMFSVGGSVFTGGSYRIPYVSGTLRVVLAITNQSDYAFDVQIAALGTTQFKTINLTPLTTYRFDSVNEHWTLSGNNSIQLFTTAGGVIALSGYEDRLLERTRITPVKAAPYF